MIWHVCVCVCRCVPVCVFGKLGGQSEWRMAPGSFIMWGDWRTAAILIYYDFGYGARLSEPKGAGEERSELMAA